MPFAGRNTDLQRSYHGRATDLHGRQTDTRRTGHGQDTDNRRTAVAGRPPYHGLLTDYTRARYGRDTGCKRAIHGRLTVGGVERVACRAGASVFVGCSFCVRSLPVWRSSCVGSCGVRARRQIARRLTGGKPKTADCGSKAQGGGRCTGTPRAYYGLHTDSGHAGPYHGLLADGHGHTRSKLLAALSPKRDKKLEKAWGSRITVNLCFFFFY